ncbi:PREDICTED: aftiphilin-like [Priapulus caudatus]|uniref:Aftiphilin-like n=1 Tax=Priapulus caudatus TaxID=37621 RepID=A0ABM1EBA6_PRICU|nr:PREDICTED: aftiphilin-like [Priapulus caudatus]XP_014669478.1 PREDICTED: aftiphilin-like [Priapulus caudatus]XP_014669479.1 PREDICTED: aftiphilin-like [Priapulus caudatus]XP_014669480.1 PREDICTED: aftiphilin-like [Priapulus caudatus]
MSNIIPVLPSSPPPLDSCTQHSWEDDDDFEAFTGAPDSPVRMPGHPSTSIPGATTQLPPDATKIQFAEDTGDDDFADWVASAPHDTDAGGGASVANVGDEIQATVPDYERQTSTLGEEGGDGPQSSQAAVAEEPDFSLSLPDASCFVDNSALQDAAEAVTIEPTEVGSVYASALTERTAEVTTEQPGGDFDQPTLQSSVADSQCEGCYDDSNGDDYGDFAAFGKNGSLPKPTTSDAADWQPDAVVDNGDFADFSAFGGVPSIESAGQCDFVTTAQSDPETTAKHDSEIGTPCNPETTHGILRDLTSQGETETIPGGASEAVISTEPLGCYRDDDDDDFAEFQESSAPVVTIDDVVASVESTLKVAEVTIGEDLQQHLEKVIEGLFLVANDLDIPEADLEPLRLQQCVVCDATDKPASDLPGAAIWSQVQKTDGTAALSYQWLESGNNRNLLKSLRIDTRNIIPKKPLVPLFATGIGLLEPMKPSDPRCEPPPVTKPSAQECIPAVEFDWGSSGLTNPLSSTVDSNLLDLSFFAREAEFSSSSGSKKGIVIGLEDQMLKEGSTGMLAGQPLQQLLAGSTPTLTANTRKSERSNLSPEASAILDGLPNLSFMRSKVLMFPVKNGNI